MPDYVCSLFFVLSVRIYVYLCICYATLTITVFKFVLWIQVTIQCDFSPPIKLIPPPPPSPRSCHIDYVSITGPTILLCSSLTRLLLSREGRSKWLIVALHSGATFIGVHLKKNQYSAECNYALSLKAFVRDFP